jgi:antiviral defense system Shedu protein SduA
LKVNFSGIREDFVVGTDKLKDIEVSPPKENSSFCWFYHARRKHLIKYFILSEQPQVIVRCDVRLIVTDGKLIPRFAFSKRRRESPDEVLTEEIEATQENRLVKASVDLDTASKHFWELMSYFQQMSELEVPKEKFSLITAEDRQFVNAVLQRGPATAKQIIQAVAKGVSFSESDINDLLQRKKRLAEFKAALDEQVEDEKWWQKFFDENKWIFGYGLNYVILRIEKREAHVVGASVTGKEAQKADFLTSSGPSKFTVLVEIKTPQTPLLRGKEPIRSRAWSFDTELTDALSQINANVEGWGNIGQDAPENQAFMDEKELRRTVKPKGIVVLGMLSNLEHDQTKLDTFELFRKGIHGIEIITFDELYDRARYIVERV